MEMQPWVYNNVSKTAEVYTADHFYVLARNVHSQPFTKKNKKKKKTKKKLNVVIYLEMMMPPFLEACKESFYSM